jgi:dihydropteroate synthase
MNRRHFVWKLKNRELLAGERTLIMGVLNVTPDSFSDGGNYLDPDRAFARAIELEEQGADILDIGAESTRPGSTRVSEAEELRRLIPVLKRLYGKLTIPISADTYKAAVAEKALEHGAEIINDPSGLTFDAQLARVTANHNAGLILNHMRGTPETWVKLPPLKDVIGSIRHDLDASVHRAVHAGMDRSRIAIDPGLGFGKRKEQNAEILSQLGGLVALDLPILVGPSRKSFLTEFNKSPETPLDYATAAAVTAAILNGAHIVRVHDVAAMKLVAMVADQILNSVGTSDSSEFHAGPPRSGGSPFRR